MGYHISYENGWAKREFREKEKRVNKKGIIWVTVISLVIVASFLLQNAEIRQFILPGNGAVTEEAIENFVSSIQRGTRLGEAVTAFCREIIENAE